MIELSSKLKQLKTDNLYRKRQAIDAFNDTVIKVHGKQYINFSTNDYLGLASDPRIMAAISNQNPGMQGCSSPLISGYSSRHQELEQKLGEFFSVPAVLMFPTGYMANLGVITAFASRGSTTLHDKDNHASLLDASILARAKIKRYRTVDELQQLIDDYSIIVTDTVFSMDGRIADLSNLVKFNIPIIIDDAHGAGLLGKTGKGCCEYLNINNSDITATTLSFAKAFGCFGGAILGSKDVIDNCVQFSRSYIYASAMPMIILNAIDASIDILRSEPWRREKLMYLTDYFVNQAAKYNLPVIPSTTPIQSILLKNESRSMFVTEQLKAEGLWVVAIRPPTVPKGTSRIRITLNYHHNQHAIDKLIITLRHILDL